MALPCDRYIFCMKLWFLSVAQALAKQDLYQKHIKLTQGEQPVVSIIL